MVLHQIQATYRPAEDRLLLRVSFAGGDRSLKEIRAWITRHLLKNLWPGIIQALETQVMLERPQAAHASAEIITMQHEATVTAIRSRGDFDAPFSADVREFPFGERPILLASAHITVGSGQTPRINFVSARSGNFEIAFSATMLHGLCALLQDAIKQADWDIDLSLPGIPTEQWSEQRVLN